MASRLLASAPLLMVSYFFFNHLGGRIRDVKVSTLVGTPQTSHIIFVLLFLFWGGHIRNVVSQPKVTDPNR